MIDWCKCAKPKPEEFRDDLGRKVTYCHRCYNPINVKEEKQP